MTNTHAATDVYTSTNTNIYTYKYTYTHTLTPFLVFVSEGNRKPM